MRFCKFCQHSDSVHVRKIGNCTITSNEYPHKLCGCVRFKK